MQDFTKWILNSNLPPQTLLLNLDENYPNIFKYKTKDIIYSVSKQLLEKYICNNY